MIEKLAREQRFLRPVLPYGTAREAQQVFLEAAGLAVDEVVLLPAFIGWSAREGSGLFDPIQNLGLAYRFYPVTADLRVDVDAFAELLRRERVGVVILVHYFGYVDPAYPVLVELARAHGARLVLEDEAHAMLSDWVGGICGRAGDACIVSLHKLFPVATGGALVFNTPAHPMLDRIATPGSPRALEFDFAGIARRRVRNATLVEELLGGLADEVAPLWPGLPEDVVPQTYPVVIRRASRNDLYFRMNEAGFGVVSLYHTLVKELSAEDFPASHELARRIMNLPVHQDAEPDQIRAMMEELGRQVRALPAAD
ncbi:MAG TPA: DegT/DnrJ/EryC1/StrS family aminotransferase [Longimicrobium sp.]|nr:DegT/DnrJ/EryC1/StrS family aminotransferase [Longimicrobium sp.]